LRGEPTATQALAAGATVVTMSGDKLLGGPQAGIVVGSAAAVAAMRSNPLTRALRVDKLTLAALEATLALYRDPVRARREIPTLARIGAPLADLRARADRLVREIDDARVTVVDSDGSVGGGAFPTTVLPSVALALEGNAAAIEAALRAGDPAIVGRIVDDRVILDLRTVAPDEEPDLVRAVRSVVA
jgi:L-seryl-tRNA(Ser) seleniumtransferase